MDKIESIEEFYRRKFGWLPNNIKNEIGHLLYPTKNLIVFVKKKNSVFLG
jgi:hypothetical protein